MKLVFFCCSLVVLCFGVSCDHNDGDNKRQVMMDKMTENAPREDFESEHISEKDESDNHVIIEGDMLLNKEQAAIYNREGWEGLVKSQAWPSILHRWDKTIPYRFSNNILLHKTPSGIQVLERIKISMKRIEEVSCIKFREMKPSEGSVHLLFERGKGCYTLLGKPTIGNVRTIYLNADCTEELTPAHLIMHTLGRKHEHTRPDRDKYVTINENTCPNQMRIDPTVQTFGIDYDYYSLMHFSQWRCAISRPGQPAMTFPGGVDKSLVGQRKKVTEKDAVHLNKIYCPSTMVRLAGAFGTYEGRIEINNNGVWGTVCSNGFDDEDANVFCKYLGHPSVEKVHNKDNSISSISTSSTANMPIWMSSLMCNGNEISPFSCNQAPIGDHYCTHDQDVTITCAKAARLVNNHKHGKNVKEGRLEIYHQGQWGSVCSHLFGFPEAKVACRMMGHLRALRAFTSAMKTDKNDGNNVVLSEVKCSGSEDHLTSCDYAINSCPTGGSPVYLQCQ